ncbi:type 1 glutamine amidotransferase domain-containing protein [Listeria kieliensis]|uniref:Cysteine protease n=1 Tax=Listeria kieliensis TaxID=1621700 RepID=A0A3D8TSZ8_9LIST|nr:type 1 glutamine amidotransferase domain-containing protein [Listeria kieliensis]RDX02128.1 cysteine protease [Listeria kieliensis]
MPKKIATLLTNLFEDVEFTNPAEAFQKAGHDVITIEKKADNQVTGKQSEATVKIDKGIDDVQPNDFDALFIPGGFSPDQLRADERFVNFVDYFIENDKPIFAICHGPQLLIQTDKLKGRTVTGFTSIRPDLKNAGANVKDEEVVVDRNLVTSRTPDDLPAFDRESLKLLQ